MKQITIFLLLFLIMFFAGCSKDKIEPSLDADSQGHTSPTETTALVNAEFGKKLLLNDHKDFENTKRNLIAQDLDLRVKNAQGELIWNQPAYEFMKGEAPSSVNPSLWRQGKLNNIHGLFQVAEGIYQLRGHDLANMTIIQGKTGWIIVDPLTAEETASRALDLAKKHLGVKPIKAIIFTHSHIDHFGGIFGVMKEEISAEKIRIIAPKGFLEEATSENIIAGIAMGRRSMFMYGKNLARSERGHVGSGLGKSPAYGTFGILAPNEIIDHTGQEKVIDGVRFVFQYAPESEAPAELAFYLPSIKAFCGAEIVSHTMHNLYTLRGTKVRNALKWSSAINDSIDLFGEAEIYFGCHHWPIWGNKEIVDFLKKQRDLYKYIHDQTVRLFNQGYTPTEIAEKLELPESLRSSFANRGYYGSLKHNARAVYQAYLGWYDGNPANLNPLPPEESGKRYIKMMGGVDAVMKRAKDYFDQGEYRWVAQLLNHLVFADPNHAEGKELLARTYDQLGYQAESAPWRDVYLSGAYELRNGAPEKGIDITILEGVLEKTPVSYFFDSMAVRLNGPKAEGKMITANIIFTDINESYELTLENSVLHHRRLVPGSLGDLTIKITHDLFIRMLVGRAGLKNTIFSDDLSVEGSKFELLKFLLLFEKPSGTFNIVTP